MEKIVRITYYATAAMLAVPAAACAAVVLAAYWVEESVRDLGGDRAEPGPAAPPGTAGPPVDIDLRDRQAARPA